MRVLVTGAAGFTAEHLVRLLETDNTLELFQTDLSLPNDNNFFRCDLTKAAEVVSLLNVAKPDRIYHLAGSYSNDYEIDYKVNVCSTKSIFDAIISLGHKCRILLIGSAAEYGVVSKESNPVGEDHPLSPVSIYGLTKTYQTMLMRCYRNIHGLDVVMARTFNLLGKGLSTKLFVGRVYEQIGSYKNGKVQRIEVGNLENKRDYIHINDAVKCYRLIMERGSAGEIYNVGSGTSIKMYDLLRMILEETGIGINVVQHATTMKSHFIDISDIYADLTKLNTLKATTAEHSGSDEILA